MNLRQRIWLTLLPMLVLLGVLGGAGVLLLHRLGGSIDVILQENYESVVAMQDLKESLERIDSSFQFMLIARELHDANERQLLEEKARKAFTENWQRYDAALTRERNNVTIHPTEDDLVDRLVALTARYRAQGMSFYERGGKGDVRNKDYYGDGALYDTFGRIKQHADDILQLNQKEMKNASNAASETANHSTFLFAVGLAVAIVMAGLTAWYTVHTVLHPIKEITQAAIGISTGNLNQVVPVPSRDELGQLAEAFNVMGRHLRDYSQSQSARLVRAQQTSQATIDSFPDPVLVIDGQGQVEMANPAARRMLGMAARDADPGSIATWHAPEPLRQPLAEALRGQRDYVPEGFDNVLLLGPGGRERAVLPRIVTIRDSYGAPLGAAIVLQDVTRLRLLDQVKGNLVATASHELKTPLTGIRLAVHLLLEETIGPLTPKQIEILLDARENCERLLARVNNLLDLARLEQGYRQLDVHPEAPELLLKSAAEAIRPSALEKGVEVMVEVPPGLPPVAVDAVRIDTALRNLLENALDYTDRGGRITLAATPGPEAVVLSVADTGIGIPPEYLPHVFDKFFRVPGQSRGSGTGLGLAIVHEIVAVHGGTITCESQPGKGTIFRLTLPIATSGPDAGAVMGHIGESKQHSL
jgi:NtrC-family two-component system sensor histidine kinase KinB